MRFCEVLFIYWQRHGLSQGRKWTILCLSLPEADRYPVDRARLLSNQAKLCYFQGDFDESSLCAEESVSIARSLDEPVVLAESIQAMAMAHAGQRKFAQAVLLFEESQMLHQQAGNIESAIYALCNQGIIHNSLGNTARAYELKAESLAQFRSHHIQRGVGFALHSLSYEDYLRGDYALAEKRDLEALQIHRDLGDKMWELINLQHLGWVSYSQGKRQQAVTYCHASLRLQKEVRRKYDIPVVLQCLAFDASDARRWSEAACLWGAESVLREAINIPKPQFHVEDYQSRLAEARTQMGTEGFDRAWTEGCRMSVEQCIEYGLAYK